MRIKTVVLYVSVPLTTIALWYFNGGMWITPDVFFVLALVVALCTQRARLFLIDWSFFLLILFSYEALRGIIPDAYGRAVRQGLIDIDTYLFGRVPSVVLQQFLWKGSPQWYDVFFTAVYVMHFVTPLLFGYALWRQSREKYYRFIVSLVMLSFAAFTVYYFIPAAPPWLAAHEGILSGITHIQTQVYMSLGASIGLVVPDVLTIYDLVGANAVAALPSLHAAYPFLLFLFARTYFGKKVTSLAALYMVTVWFAVIYLGDHYVVDVLLGIVFAGIAYVVANYAIDKFSHSPTYHQLLSLDHWLQNVETPSVRKDVISKKN